MRDSFWGTMDPDSTAPLTPHQVASESRASSSKDNNVVEMSHNRIYFYSGVTRPKILQLNKNIFSLNTNLLAKSVPLEYTPPPIKMSSKVVPFALIHWMVCAVPSIFVTVGGILQLLVGTFAIAFNWSEVKLDTVLESI